MPVPPPPPPGHPDPTTFSSAPTVGQKLQPMFQEVAQQLQLPAVRWEALKGLRVMSIADQVHLRGDLDNQYPQALERVLEHPRLSRLAHLAGCSLIDGNPEHLDLDWFGKRYQNFWGGNTSGRKLELSLGAELEKVITASYPLSTPGPKGWLWGAPSFGSWQADLKWQAPPILPSLPQIVIEWTCWTGHGDPMISSKGLTLEVKSRWPRMAIQLI